mgnify:CR=1 FL=1|tara:strand:+ start:1354 stop:1923 length:570 start_codon:yes stop_codon:yes gene_type:complete
MQVKLEKAFKENVYTSEQQITITGTKCKIVGSIQITKAYLDNDNLRICEYRVWLKCNDKEVQKEFSVLGRWATRVRGSKYCTQIDNIRVGYDTSKEAKAAAMAFIEEVVNDFEATQPTNKKPAVTYDQVQTLMSILNSGVGAGTNEHGMDSDEEIVITSSGKNGGVFKVTIQYNEYDQRWHHNATKIEQ